MKKPKGFFTAIGFWDVVRILSDEQAGKLYKALFRYADKGELTDFTHDNALYMAYTVFKNEIDVNFANYRKVCEARQTAALNREKTKREFADKKKPAPVKGFGDRLTSEEADELEEAIRLKYAHIYED